jgi:hypothetical protein
MSEMLSPDVIAANRNAVSDSFRAAVSENRRRYLRGDANAGSEYVFPNQMEDAVAVTRMFYEDNYSAVSVIKKTKVGANGFMIALAYHMTTHSDDDFVVNPDNVRFITGMSNKKWEDDMKGDAPTIFKDKVFHHGSLKDANLSGLRDALIFIDEIDTGSNEKMVLETTLSESGLLDIEVMKNNNIRFVVISATMTRELYQMYRWGEQHHNIYRMTIPPNYIGHEDFVKMNIVCEFYPVNTLESAFKWVKEDLVDNYGTDYRVGIIRTTAKDRNHIANACALLGVGFRDHTSTDRIDDAEFKTIFEAPRSKHIVIAVKGLYRRANLIPNRWKKVIGPVHEAHGQAPDANVQTQGLIGRMTGYWRDIVENGHKTGPYRTSLQAIEQSVNAYADPFGKCPINTRDFKKRKGGEVKRNIPSLVEVNNIANLSGRDAPAHSVTDTVPKEIKLSSEENEILSRHVKESSWDEYRPKILEMIEKHCPGYLATLPNVSPKIIEPIETRNKIIRKLVDACAKGQQYNWNDNQIKHDTFKVYVDRVESRLFVSVCNGSRRR